MNIDLPDGWTMTTIGETSIYISRGKSPKYTEKSDLPVVNQKAIRWFGIENEHLKFIHPDQIDKWPSDRFIREGDILWNSTGTGTVGRACIVKKKDLITPKVVDSHVTIVRCNQSIIDPLYLFAWIRGPKIQNSIADMASGTTNQIELSRNAIAATELPLAPLPEQKRIADKLDALLARVDACRERLGRVPQILKRFRQSILAAATSGKLTEEWRAQTEAQKKDPEPNWVIHSLSECCLIDRIITYGVIKLGNDVPEGVPCLRTSNVRWLRIDTEGIKRISTKLSSDYSRTILQGTEVLVNVRGTLGGVAVVQDDMAGWNVSREIAVIPVDRKKVIPTFLAFWIASEASQQWLDGVEKGIAYVGINIEDLRKLPLKLPKMEEQREIVRRVESLFAYADRLEARYQSARDRIDRLTPALLAKAFRGELVPQDPSDEPAAALVERIRLGHAAPGEPAGKPVQRQGRKPRRLR